MTQVGRPAGGTGPGTECEGGSRLGVAQGLTNAEIAQRLTIAPDSVKKNVTRILAKLDLRDRVQLVILMRDVQS